MISNASYQNDNALAAQRIRLIMHLRQAGITDTNVLSAIERVPREIFVPPAFHDQAYEDTALPIGLGQTVSQPFIVASMTQALELSETDKVLEIGTGSGYQAAILAQLCKRLYTIERHRALLERAQERFDYLGLRNVVAMTGDGMKGWPQQAPFDKIIVTAGAPEPPRELIDQIKPGGIVVTPLGAESQSQVLTKIRKNEDGGLDKTPLCDVRFVPLLPGTGGKDLPMTDPNSLQHLS